MAELQQKIKITGRGYFLIDLFGFIEKNIYFCDERDEDMSVTFDEAEKKNVFDFEHDGKAWIDGTRNANP